ncbi:MAG TPA: DUF4062 domain-containing protein [Pyrinomonadaceae bacterium]|nr:DUF4062 domain-containing protein [Pyrinomonadaceae bacterium]
MSQRTNRPVAVIGSAARAYPAHVNQALEVCLRLGVIPVMVERPAAASDGEAVESALGLIDEADVYIGIFGSGRGDRSIAGMEYDRAVVRGIPRLVFIVGEGGPRGVAGPTGDATEDFLDRVRMKQPVAEVGSAEEFRDLLDRALGALGIRGQVSRGVKPNIRFGGGRGKDAQPGAYKRVLRVFVASPRDVQDERSRMPKVVDSLNRTLGKLLDVAVELWRWEIDATPAAGETQALVDLELDKADVVLVIFWNRFGTPTPAGPTGTEGEVLRAVERWSKARHPQVMVYFCQRPARLERAELEQRLKLLEFRERLAQLVLIADYEDAHEFEWRVRDDLFTTIAALCVRRK